MITFIPPYLGEEIKSNAEIKIYETLQDLRIKNAYVLHSLGLPRHQSKIYGEIDFVVVCSRGVACLEIKGGRVECHNGRWLFTDRYGVEREKPEGPFAQVIGNMFSLRNILKQRFQNRANAKHIQLACGVIFPDIEFNSSSQELITDIIFDKKTADISEYINGIFDYWESRGHQPPDVLSPKDIEEIVDFLRSDFCFIPTLNDRLEAVEQKLIRLTSEQVQVMDALALNEHLLIEGGAGTGKTLIATDYAMKMASTGKRVLYLTFNKNLSFHINKCVKPCDNIKIINIHALFGEYVPIDTNKLKINPQKYFSEELPLSFYNYVTGLSQEEAEELKYDLLIMDEGQDILKPDYLYSLDFLLRGGFEKGRWAVFYDEHQNIYNPEYDEGLSLLLSYHCTKFKLFINCRNTIQIGTYSAKVSGIETNSFINENGEEVQKISYSDSDNFKSSVKDILKLLKKEKVSLTDIVFLSPKKYNNSLLCEINIPVYELGSAYDNADKLPIFATIQGFKGLDSKVIILIDVDDITDRNFSRFLYIAGTRARTLLYIIGSDSFWANHKA